MFKVAIIQTHPIQHFCPQFASFSNLTNIDLLVIFETKHGLETYFDKQFNKEIKWEGIDLDRFPHLFIENDEITNILNKNNPDVVIVYGYHKKVQKKSYNWAIKNNKKIFYISDTEEHQKRNSFKVLIKKILLRKYFKHIDVFLSVGDANEDYYKSMGVSKKKIVRMFFPVDTQSLENAKKSNAVNNLKKNYEIPENTFVITCIGKLVHWKSQQDIIFLLKKLEDNGINAVGILIGSGPDYELLKNLSRKLEKNKIIFTEFIQPHEIFKILSISDVYIHPAKKEPHSLAISEAIYLGLPVIVSDRCGSYGPNDDVQPGVNGFVYPYGDIDILYKYVKFFINNPSLKKEFSDQSISISRKNQKLAHGQALIAAINIIQV